MPVQTAKHAITVTNETAAGTPSGTPWIVLGESSPAVLPFYESNTTAPPTSAEVVALAGLPVQGAFALLMDTGGVMYLVAANGTAWYQVPMVLTV
jgi:hypothetical protein